MGFFNKEVELIVPPKKQNTHNKTVNAKSLNGYDAIREKLDEGNTLSERASATRRAPVEQNTKPARGSCAPPKVSIGL